MQWHTESNDGRCQEMGRSSIFRRYQRLEAEYQKTARRMQSCGQAGYGWHYSAGNFTWMRTSWKRLGSRPVFFQQYEQDISAVMDRLRKEYPRIYPYEEDAVRFWYAEYYYAALETLCRDMMGR